MIGTRTGTETRTRTGNPTETETRYLTRPSLGPNPRLGTNVSMNTGTGTVPILEQLDFFSKVCLVRKSVAKPKLHRSLTPKEKHILKQVRSLNDPLIIEAINLFNAEVHGVGPGLCSGPTESGLCQRHELALVRSKSAREICSSKGRHHQKNGEEKS